MTHPTADCLEEEVLAELVAARLPADAAARAEAHIDACAACRRLLAELLRQCTPAAGAALASEVAPTLASGAPESGQRIGRFVLRERLGQGGMGVVFVAYDPELAREVALKLVRPRRSPVADAPPPAGEARAGGAVAAEHAQLERTQLRLLREAQAMARLSHPNVRAVYEVGAAAGQVYIAMELVSGVSAREYLRAEPRSLDEILDLFIQAGQGLSAAHEAGLLHRDFKPDNILVSSDRRVLITDFGLARPDGSLAGADSDSDGDARLPLTLPLSQSGAALGTPGYIAPEQLRGEALDARVDQWSFCVALYEALYGARPFSFTTAAELPAAILRGVRFPRVARPVPGWLQQALRRGLATEPAGRFPSMAALLSELRSGPQRRQSRRRAALALAAGVALLAGSTAGYWTLLRPERQCVQDARRRIAEAWGPARQAQAERAALGLRLPYGGEVMRRVALALDGYAGRWLGAAEELCQSARPLRAAPDALLPQRARCLELRRRELSALSAQLLLADAATLEQAIPAAASLTRISDCRGSAVASARHQLPSDAAERQKADVAYGELAEAKALQRTGHSAQALAKLVRTMAAVKTPLHRPLWAELQLLRGSLELDGGDLRAAETALHEAVLASEAGSHDEALALAWIKLIEVGARAATLETAEAWSRHATAVVERLGSELYLSALLENSLAMLRLAQGRRAEAQKHQQRALVLLAQSGAGPDGAQRERVAIDSAKLLTNLGALQSSLGQHAEALASHHRAVEQFERELGPEHPAVANALLNLGAALGASGDTDGEIAAYERCLKIWEPALGKTHVNLGTVHQNLGTALRAREQPAAALVHFEQALAIKRQHLPADHPSLASSLFSLGATLHKLGRSDAGLAALNEALRSFEKRLGPDHPLVAKALTEIGLVHLDQGQPAAAVAALSRALGTGSDADFDPAERAETRFGLARALRAAGREPQRARTLAEQALVDYADPEYAGERATITRWLRAR